jgi:hypothetical protein
MYAVLMAAALAVGSGDGRDGATDARMVESVPPYTLLRKGMSYWQVCELLGRESFGVNVRNNWTWCYNLSPDPFGRRYQVVLHAIWDKEGSRVIDITVQLCGDSDSKGKSTGQPATKPPE